ncbi:MAG: hypothetical protein R2748_30370 [Bryobacterales bacterium]
MWPGYVSVSAASALNLAPEGGMTLFAKLSSRMLTLSVVDADGCVWSAPLSAHPNP